MSKILEAINAIMAEVGSVGKSGMNEFQHYKYAQVSDILKVVQPLLAKHGLIIIQHELTRELVGNDSLLAITYHFVLAHSSGEFLSRPSELGSDTATIFRIAQTGMSSVRNSKGGYDDKAANKCHTAARKYFILALFQIPTVEMDAIDADRQPDVPAIQSPSIVPALPVTPTERGVRAPETIPSEQVKAADWINEFSSAVHGAGSVTEIDEWIALNETALNRLEMKAARLYVKLMASVAAERDMLRIQEASPPLPQPVDSDADRAAA